MLFFVLAALAGALVDINNADAVTLESLPGIGESTAAKIIAYRESNGPFASVDDLDAVSGIGEKTMEKLRPLVTVSAPATGGTRAAAATAATGETAETAPDPASPAAATAATVPSAAAGCPVNINTADAAGLDALPGVGEAKAADIIAYRMANGAFSSCDALDSVSGFGASTIEKLRACCVVR